MRSRLRYDTDFEITKQEIMISVLRNPVEKVDSMQRILK